MHATDPDGDTGRDLPEIPVISGGESTTIETERLRGIGGPVATVARTPRVTARDAIGTARTEGFDALASIPIRELLDRVADAGRRFAGIGPPTEGMADRDVYEERVARSTGLPVGWVRTSGHWLSYGLRHAAETLRAQSPTGGLAVYDDPAYTRETNVGLAFAPRVRVLGAVMPGNDPAVYAWPALALAMKIPVVIRPSDRDPFTAVRLARALLAAGLPASAVHALPGERALGGTICREADHGMVFGGASAVNAYREDPSVEAYGPGDSVAVVAREPTARELDTLARGVVRAGGRTCFNLTRIVATGDCDPDSLADALARRVAETRAGSVLDPRADVPLFPDPDRAGRIDDRVAAIEGTDVTAAYRDGPRLETVDGVDGAARLRPTVFRAQSGVTEFPFQFAGVTERDRGEVVDGIEADPAYLGVVVGDADLERRLVRSPAVRKLYGGRYPAAVDLRETHEEFLASFLYDTTTYDPGD